MFVTPEAHRELLTAPVLMLAEFHWYLLRAAQLVESHRRARDAERSGKQSTSGDPSIGRDIESDEIHWWVFKREGAINELLDRTKEALRAGQSLKEAAGLLHDHTPTSYEELL